MKKMMSLFFILLFLYFVFVQPVIIYYWGGYQIQDLDQVSSEQASIYLVLSVALWACIFGLSLRLLFKQSFVAQANIRKILRNGISLPARIIESRSLKMLNKQMETKKLILELNNLQGETIWQEMNVNDSKPLENRYEVGKTIILRVDDTFSRPPYYVLDGVKSKINYRPFAVWLVFLIGVLFFYEYSYNLESAGYGWRFLTFEHPLISSAVFLLFFTGIIYLISRFLFSKKSGIGGKNIVLKFKGKKTFARVIHARQTGVFINEQPQVEFSIEFKDHNGIQHQGTIRKIVSLIDIGTVRSNVEKEIFYDPNNPTHVLFEEDINAI